LSYKRVIHANKNRYTLQNMQYTQQFIDTFNQTDPHTLRFMDEMGVKMTDGHPTYGHSEKGCPCVELTRYDAHANCTVSVIMGLTGVKYVKIIDGASNSQEYMQYIGEATESYTDDGEPVLSPGDTLIVDNAPIHHNESQRILTPYLGQMGISYRFLPTYSPDLNPAEQCFRKVKKRLKSEEYAQLIKRDLKVAVYKAFSEVTSFDTMTFFHSTEYLPV
jgi:transposase